MSQGPVELGCVYADLDDLPVSPNLISRSERVNSTELGPSHGHQARRAVEFHGAASQWNHCVDQTEILRLQVVDVTEHLRFRVVCVEHLVREELGLSLKSGRQG